MWETCKTCGKRDRYANEDDVCNNCGAILNVENLARRGSIYGDEYKKKNKKKTGFFEQDENGKAPFMEMFYNIILIVFVISLILGFLL